MSGLQKQPRFLVNNRTSISANSRVANEIANKFLQIDNVEIVISEVLFADYSSKATGGYLAIRKYGRIAIMTFSDVYLTSDGDLFDLIQNPMLPLNQFEGYLISASGGTPLRLWLRTNGTAGCAGTSTPQGGYSGSVVYITAN